MIIGSSEFGAYARFWPDAVTQGRVPIVYITLGDSSVAIKPGPKRIAKSIGTPDRCQRDNKDTFGNTPGLKPYKHKKGS